MSNAAIVAPATSSINTLDDHPHADPSTALDARIAERAAATYAEIHSLALELCEHEGYTFANAMHAAALDLDVVLAYGTTWDRAAFYAGNDDALPF